MSDTFWILSGKIAWAFLALCALLAFIFSKKDEPKTPHEKLQKIFRQRAAKFTAVLMLFCLSANAQRGVYAWTGDVTAQKLHLYKTLGYSGVILTARWYDDQPTKTDLSHAWVVSRVRQICDSGLEVLVHTWKGDLSPINWLVAEGVDTFSTTDGSRPGPWPNYYSATYISYSNQYDKTLADSLISLFNSRTSVRNKLKAIFSAYGSSGDPQPYKGTAPPPYNTTIQADDTWYAYVQVRMDSLVNYYSTISDSFVLAMNGGNDAVRLKPWIDRYTGSLQKHGDPSHRYPVYGENYKMNWPSSVYFGEFDDAIRLSPYYADQLQCIFSFLSLKTLQAEFFDGWSVNNPHVAEYAALIIKYITQYNPATANKGFCALAEKVDFLDSVNYPISTYGNVFSNNASYWAAIANTNANSYDTFRKQMRYVAIADFFKYTPRLNALIAAGYKYSPDSKTGYSYNNDICFYCRQNYSLNITQLKIYETSIGVFRVDGGSIYGRNAKKIKKYNGYNSFYFDIDDNLKNSDASDAVDITVTYLDQGTASWNIQCYKCLKKSITNTNSNTWKQVTLSVPHFKWGNKMRYNADVIINHIKGETFPIALIEVVNKSK